MCEIVKDVSSAIISHLRGQIRESITEFKDLWQIPCCIGRLDGCHLSISAQLEEIKVQCNSAIS